MLSIKLFSGKCLGKKIPDTLSKGIKKVMQLKALVGIIAGMCACGWAYANPMEKRYPVELDHIVEKVLEQSFEIQALKERINAAELTLNVEKGYYMPKATIANESKRLYGKPVLPSETTSDAILNISSKLYGSETGKKINAAEMGVLSNGLLLQQKELEFYYKVLNYLAKIERTRYYEYEASLLRREVVQYLERARNAARVGASPSSDMRESELNLARFDDAVLAAVSAKERFFDELKQETGFEVVNRDEVGIPYQVVRDFIEVRSYEFNDSKILANNLEIRSKTAAAEQTRLSAEAQNEKLTMSFISEAQMSAVEDKIGVQPGEFRNKSYVGLRVDYQLYDFQKSTSQLAALAAYKDEKNTLLDRERKLKAEVLKLKNTLSSLMQKRENLLDQIRLSRELIETQKKEVLLDKVSFSDMSKAFILFNQAYSGLLNLDVQIYDVVFEYAKINAEKFL